MASGNGNDPGLFTLARHALRAGLEERAARASEARWVQQQHDHAARMLAEASRLIVDDEPGNWQPILYGTNRLQELDAQEYQDLRQRALRASLRHPHMAGYLRSLKRFVMGKGPAFSPELDDERLVGRMDEWWTRWKRFNNWDSREDEIPWRVWRDGEAFIRRFPWSPDRVFTPSTEVQARLAELGAEDLELSGEDVPRGMMVIRLLDPDHIQDPLGIITHGIVTDKDDVETVLGYCWTAGGDDVREVVPARDVVHTKVNVDSDVKRGRTMLEPLLQLDKWYMDWLRYRVALNMVRAAVVLVKKIEGTRTELARIREAGQVTGHGAAGEGVSGNTRRQRMLQPGTTVQATPGVSYEFLSPNLDAQDARYDGRHILLSQAAATGLPEYMFTGDASNANFASTMVAEGPAVREFEDWQDRFTGPFATIYRWAMEDAAEEGAIEGLSVDAARDVEVTLDWPPMVAREELDHAKANALRAEGGILSKEGWALDEGLDWEVEKERIKAEMEDAMEMLGPEMQARAAAMAGDGVPPGEEEEPAGGE